MISRSISKKILSDVIEAVEANQGNVVRLRAKKLEAQAYGYIRFERC